MADCNRDEKKWVYDNDRRKTAKLCAKFHIKWVAEDKSYLRYASLSKRVLSDSNHILTRKQYNKLCGNKLSKRVIKESLSKRKFSPSERVTFKKSLPYIIELNAYLSHKTNAIVIEYIENITKPAKGAKKYRVIPYGITTVIEVEERYIKKIK